MGGSATALFGVFDGHGVDGRKVSNAVASRLPKLLGECADFKARREPSSALCNQRKGFSTNLAAACKIGQSPELA